MQIKLEGWCLIPRYDYNCSQCGVKEYFQGYHDNPFTTCPSCGNDEIYRVISIPNVIIDGSCKTLGALADKNAKTLGATFKEDQRHKWLEGKRNASKFLGTIPEGGHSADKQEYIPPWRDSPTIDRSLAKYAPTERGGELSPQAEKFIMTGEKT